MLSGLMLNSFKSFTICANYLMKEANKIDMTIWMAVNRN